MPHSILLIDDHPSYCDQLKEEALKHNLLISAFHNLEEGINFLVSNRKIKAVILDGRCLLYKKQADAPKSNFVFHAIQDIEEIQDLKKREIPYCVCSETPEDFSEDLEGIAPIFDKNKPPDEMFEYLIARIKILPELIVRERYPTIFSFADANFNEKDIEILENTSINIESSSQGIIISNLTSIRRLEESFFDLMCVNYLGKAPESFVSGKSNRTKNIYFYFYRQDLLPKFLLNFAELIYKISSKYGNHADLQQTEKYYPERFSASSLLNMLFALYEWGNLLLESLSQLKTKDEKKQ
ncbi:MAG: hypothetical protein GX437_13075 [Sphingobacteriales bacterium]|nr:hypothetical protein [Sphingobacteriales bacterium]